MDALSTGLRTSLQMCEVHGPYQAPLLFFGANQMLGRCPLCVDEFEKKKSKTKSNAWQNPQP